jgi:hypothetical protein
MPRKLRIQYPGAIYHVMSRGARRWKLLQELIPCSQSSWGGYGPGEPEQPERPAESKQTHPRFSTVHLS